MVIVLCPVIAGDGVGLCGWILEHLASPLRTFPAILPGWMVVLSSTLGCRQGTLYRAPRGAEAKLADDNVFCKNRFWTELTCQATVPLALSHLKHQV